MADPKQFCFVIMPFRPELNYFYLYLKGHVERIHNVACERGDAQVMTSPLSAKINDYIRRADVVIADCTGRNANVFYELGIAHALDKKVILITSDEPDRIPTDVRQYEFIPYNLSRHVEFFERLDNALRNAFGSQYRQYYESARVILRDFNRQTDSYVGMPPNETFFNKLSHLEHALGKLPPADDYLSVARLVMQIIGGNDGGLMRRTLDWLDAKGRQQPPPRFPPHA